MTLVRWLFCLFFFLIAIIIIIALSFSLLCFFFCVCALLIYCTLDFVGSSLVFCSSIPIIHSTHPKSPFIHMNCSFIKCNYVWRIERQAAIRYVIFKQQQIRKQFDYHWTKEKRRQRAHTHKKGSSESRHREILCIVDDSSSSSSIYLSIGLVKFHSTRIELKLYTQCVLNHTRRFWNFAWVSAKF